MRNCRHLRCRHALRMPVFPEQAQLMLGVQPGCDLMLSVRPRLSMLQLLHTQPCSPSVVKDRLLHKGPAPPVR